MNMDETIDSTLNHILSRVKVAGDAEQLAKGATSQQRTAECAARNGVTALAKLICQELGKSLAREFASEVVRESGWSPPVECKE